MDDCQIVELYLIRDERALQETQIKYSRYCHYIAMNFLHNLEDSEEVVNDTFCATWNAIPPHTPSNLRTFIGKIARHLSLKKTRSKAAGKRGLKESELVFHELEESIPTGCHIDENLSQHELTQRINDFLRLLPTDERRVFVCRYWYFDSIEAISQRFSFSQSKVKMMLMRTRKQLWLQLQKEGYVI